MNEKVSVIVPIYKVEKYLRKCIDSLISQSYKNLEIILVDDGSPDNCGIICDEYSKLDERIKVIHKKNGGLSDARNAGLKVVTGEFIIFVDSDDYVSNDYIEYMYNLILKTKADIGIVMELKFNGNVKIPRVKEKIKIYDSCEGLISMLYQKEFSNGVNSKIYSRKIIDGIEFPVGEIYEDLGTIYKYFLKAKKIVFSNLPKYYYLQRNDSIMGSSFKKQDMDYIYQAEKLRKDVEILNDDIVNKAAISRYISANFSVLLKIKRNKKYNNIRKEILDNIKKYRLKVLMDKNARLKNKIALLLSYVGVF